MGIIMSELAEMAKVSRSTVSLVLNGKADGRIARAKQEKILKLAEQYNYCPNRIARGLKTNRMYAIGVAMPSPGVQFYGDMAERLQLGLAAHGYSAIFSFWLNQEGIRKTFSTISSHECDGLIAWDPEFTIPDSAVPTVFFGERLPNCDCVSLDAEQVVHEAFEYLVSLGHRRIGFTGGFMDARFSWYKQFLKKYHLEFNPAWCSEKLTFPGVLENLERIMQSDSRPTAMLANNDVIAYMFVDAAARLKIELPRELSLVGFNNIPESCHRHPSMTTFDSRNEEIAENLIRLMLRRIENPDAPFENAIIPVKMIVRDSCCHI